MSPVLDLLRRESRARTFFLALAQSALGTGAGYVALLLVALDRFDSPWAVGLILLADVVPSMFLGPLFGAFADRFSRRACVIAGDLLRAVAFIGLVLVDGFAATLALALLAGAGTGLFTPAALAALPSLVEKDRLPAATSLYGAIADFGFIAGPAVAALILLVGGPETILAANGVTFALSAALLVLLRFGPAPSREAGGGPTRSLLQDTKEGLVATAGVPMVRLVLLASGSALLCGAVFNVAQPLLAQEELGTTDAGFAALVTTYGVGFIAGSLAGSSGGSFALLRRRYLSGALLMALGFAGSGLAPAIGAAVVTFLAAGFGNGLLLVYERLLIQALVPDALAGRTFGVRDAITAWAFAAGFLLGPLMVNAFGVREVITGAGVVGLVVWLAAVFGFRRARGSGPGEPLARRRGADLAWDRSAGEHGADLVRG